MYSAVELGGMRIRGRHPHSCGGDGGDVRGGRRGEEGETGGGKQEGNKRLYLCLNWSKGSEGAVPLLSRALK